ncbi:MAG: acyl-CoA/acyl-ACP dehydrogenase [Roseovarius sp.]|nr:acyl-CoA/acyl-ACP dehydrogenase [Roseovarius sp.]
MQFSFTEDQQMIRDTAESLVARSCQMTEVRAFGDGQSDFVDALWQDLAKAGFNGALVAESHGGSGLGMLEAGIALEALGGALAPVPFLSTTAVADLIGRLGSDEQKSRYLSKIAAGQISAAIVGCPDPAHRDENGALRGQWAPVANAESADLLLVVVADTATGDADSYSVNVIEDIKDSCTVETFDTMDRTRRGFGAITLTGAAGVPLAGSLDGDGYARLGAILAAGSAVEMLGGAVQVLEMAKTYAMERVQFGRPIGAFQAIKHMLADQLVALEGLRSLVWAALWAIDNAPEEAPLAAATAKAVADQVALQLAGENIQIHGGIGFTADIDAHLYVKRVQLDRLVWGPPGIHTDFLEAHLEEMA